jgi:hypothetical protein
MGDRLDLVTAFAALDRARLSHMDQSARSEQLDARETFRSYVESLWQDVQRSGEHPEVGDKYQALALVRELARSLTVVAFDETHDGESTAPGPG